MKKKLKSRKLVVENFKLHKMTDLRIKGYTFFSIGDTVRSEGGNWVWLVTNGEKVFLITAGQADYKHGAAIINYVPGQSTRKDAEELRQLLLQSDLEHSRGWWDVDDE